MFCHLFPVAGNAWAGFSTSPVVCLYVYVYYDTLFKSSNRAAATDTLSWQPCHFAMMLKHLLMVNCSIVINHPLDSPDPMPDKFFSLSESENHSQRKMVLYSSMKLWGKVSRAQMRIFKYRRSWMIWPTLHVLIERLIASCQIVMYLSQWMMALAYSSVSELIAVTVWPE
jgi:hypothetical protein